MMGHEVRISQSGGSVASPRCSGRKIHDNRPVGVVNAPFPAILQMQPQRLAWLKCYHLVNPAYLASQTIQIIFL